jgi:hypothetical protein
MEEPLTAKVAKKKHAKVAEIISLCVLGENFAYFAVGGFWRTSRVLAFWEKLSAAKVFLESGRTEANCSRIPRQRL